MLSLSCGSAGRAGKDARRSIPATTTPYRVIRCTAKPPGRETKNDATLLPIYRSELLRVVQRMKMHFGTRVHTHTWGMCLCICVRDTFRDSANRNTHTHGWSDSTRCTHTHARAPSCCHRIGILFSSRVQTHVNPCHRYDGFATRATRRMCARFRVRRMCVHNQSRARARKRCRFNLQISVSSKLAQIIEPGVCVCDKFDMLACI